MSRLIGLAMIALLVTTLAMCGSEESATQGGIGAGVGTAGWAPGGGQVGGFGPSGGSDVGGCGASCVPDETGVGTDNPFDPGSHDSEGVGLDPDGALVLDQSQTGVPDIIWIANTSAGTVTKVDTNTYAILGRYAIGPAGTTLDPSRTSVNSLGDVFVGNRGGNQLIKISAAGADCPDTNGDSQVTTSTGFDDVKPWGQDDCVLWNVDVPNAPLVRGVAAQDLEVAAPIPDDPNHTEIIHRVWTGGTQTATAFLYDGDTGQLLVQTQAPSTIYGLALDGRGQLWLSGAADPGPPSGRILGRIDTTKCVDQASCDAAEICYSHCDDTGACVCDQCNQSSCDDATKERITLTTQMYGITVDYKQRVWMGGMGVKRYNPLAPANQRYAVVQTGQYIHGIAADAEGWVWGGDGGSNVARINGDTLEFTVIPNVPSKGMAVDRAGKIWVISYFNGANVIVPGPTLNDHSPQVPAGANPALGAALCPSMCYTYSDMTGQQLALAANDPGYYREVFDGCPSGDTNWMHLFWEAETPPNTSVRFYARTADTLEGLEAAGWVTIATVMPDISPVALAAAFSGQPMGRYLEVEVRLYGNIGLDGLVSPRVLSFGATHSCQDTPT